MATTGCENIYVTALFLFVSIAVAPFSPGTLAFTFYFIIKTKKINVETIIVVEWIELLSATPTFLHG